MGAIAAFARTICNHHGILRPMALDETTVALPQFAVSIHQHDDVAAACLTLQDVCGADVNLVLCAAYLGAVHAMVPDDTQIGALRSAVTDWHRDVVQPLRLIRRRLKTGPAPAPSESTARLRAHLQRDEIEAEMIELTTLQELVDTWPTAPTSGTADVARAAVLRILPLDAEETEDIRDAVSIIARATVQP